MNRDISYTTEEISKLLKISKLTVYDLIKKGELTAYRVGKQMRIDASDLEAYIQRSKMSSVVEPQTEHALPPQMATSPYPVYSPRPVVITGQDISLDILANVMAAHISGTRPLRAQIGSMDSLIALYKGESDIVSTHLLDGDSGEYNIPYIKRLLVGTSYIVVNLLSRNAGLYVQTGNPHNVQNWSDLSKAGIRIVNREKGSGARVLLDEQLRLNGIHAGQVLGYDQVVTNHLAVAAKVSSGEADVGVGNEKAASIVGNVVFIPLIKERYDLVIKKGPENHFLIEQVLKILSSEAFQNELKMLQGYDLSQTGKILLET
ncbi:PBP superfamily domain protein [compost metagenome]